MLYHVLHVQHSYGLMSFEPEFYCVYLTQQLRSCALYDIVVGVVGVDVDWEGLLSLRCAICER